MRTNLEFRSADLMDAGTDEEIPKGEKLAALLHDRLPAFGYAPTGKHMEGWGWCVTLANADFPLWIGCGHYEEYPDGHLCFIEPSKPFVRRWFRKISTVETVEALAKVIEQIVRETGVARDLSWHSELEILG